MRVAVVGLGRMGHEIAREAERRGHSIVARLGRDRNENGGGLTRDALAAAEVVFEFTRPDAVAGNLERLAALGATVVCGTTGWDGELPRISALVSAGSGALLHATNFSIGMHLTRHAARALAALLPRFPEFDTAIHETHHRKKLDSPSGTAQTLQADLRAADPGRAHPITSTRVGSVPGTHALVIDGEHETIELTHTARDRSIFAIGAVVAGEWLRGRRGVFTFDDLFRGGTP
jgi:4-hydroxy-tetrahydrodipicolinate reductase